MGTSRPPRVCVCGKNESVHFSDVCSVTCLCGHVMFVVFMVEPLLCGGMGSEGGGRSSEGGAGWEDRWREAAGRIAVGGGWESALLSFNDLFVVSLDVCS